MKTDDKGIRTYGPVPYRPKGTGPDSAGQSGDTQGIDDPEEEALLEEGQVDAAIASYERAIAGDREYANAYLNLGVAYKRAGRLAEAVRALRDAQRLEQRAIAANSWRQARRR